MSSGGTNAGTGAPPADDAHASAARRTAALLERVGIALLVASSAWGGASYFRPSLGFAAVGVAVVGFALVAFARRAERRSRITTVEPIRS